jgi:nitroimidazol reductase NimA-like FMN-containing flavoprotein (pyridoxamine 5'-phosphate oxidase superfamily)
MTSYQPTHKTKVRRRPERATYDRDVVHRVIDEALVCHVGFVLDGEPQVLPTMILRIDEDVYIHGSTKNGLLTALAAGASACITVTLLDSIVAGRSGFGCSVDYRSVVIYAEGEVVPDTDKELIMDAFVQDLIPGHSVRRLTTPELNATMVLRFPLHEVSAKVRDKGVIDVESDYQLDLWAGVIPIKLSAGQPIGDHRLKPGIEVPDFATRYHR